jgi:hypothetical protein
MVHSADDRHFLEGSLKLTSSLTALVDGRLPASFEGLKSHVDADWIESALTAEGTARLRRRKLPAEQVVWLVIGMALYRDLPIEDVVHRLDLVMPEGNGKPGRVSKGALPPARHRIGADPLERLFAQVSSSWGMESAQRHLWRGLKVFGGDGTTLRVPDSAANRQAFGLPKGKSRTASYPQVRCAALMVLGSHVLYDFAFGSYTVAEQTLMGPLIDRLPDRSLIILDRAYVDYQRLYRLQRQGRRRHWLIRLRKGLHWRVIQRLGPGDSLVEIRFSPPTRKAHPEWPETFVARLIQSKRPGFRPRTILTSLVDPKAYPAQEVSGLYEQRWELELGYDEMKTHTLERFETLRSETPEGIRQEVWGIAIAYNLVRREMEAVAQAMKVSPQRISYRSTLMFVRDLFLWAPLNTPGRLPWRMRRVHEDIRRLVLPPRRTERSYPRQVKIVWSHYPRNNGHPKAPTRKALN